MRPNVSYVSRASTIRRAAAPTRATIVSSCTSCLIAITERGGERGQESVRRWLYVPAIQDDRPDVGTGEPTQSPNEARFADATGTVKKSNDKRKLRRLNRGVELSQLPITTDE